MQVCYVRSHAILFCRGNNRLTWPSSLFCNLPHNYSMISLFRCPTKWRVPATNVGKMKPFKFLRLTTPQVANRLDTYAYGNFVHVPYQYGINTRFVLNTTSLHSPAHFNVAISGLRYSIQYTKAISKALLGKQLASYYYILICFISNSLAFCGLQHRSLTLWSKICDQSNPQIIGRNQCLDLGLD